MLISSTDALTTYAQELPFALLKPKLCPPRTGLYTGTDLTEICDRLEQSHTPIAIDFETRGTDPTLPDTYSVGMGLAGASLCVYISNRSIIDELIYFLIDKQIPCIAHNVSFDGQWVFHKYGRHLNWHACTYALYRHTATEGWPGQKWGLKQAMTELLQWQDTNTAELDQWLTDNGYINQSKNVQYGEMWRAPAEILGKYCALDAEATYLLYTEILEPVMLQFPELVEYHTNEFMTLTRTLIEQRLRGLAVDRPALEAAHNEITGELEPVEKWLRTESVLAPHIQQWQSTKLVEFLATMPEKYLKSKLGAEPAKFTSKGTVSKNWSKWYEKSLLPPVVSKTWENWCIKQAAIISGENKLATFNLRSGDHLRWLFYDALGYKPHEFTETGLPKVDTDSLHQFGEAGQALEKLLLLHKEHGFTTKYLELTESRNTIHPGFRVPGTLTGRLSGVEPNIQQVPKSRRFLNTLVARPGHVWIDADFSSLEPVVTAEFSNDPTLMAIYGPKSDPGADIYLHTGAGIPALAGAIRASGYIPEKTITLEIAAHTKKVCKRERAICKTLFLGANYGAGARKIYKTLVMQGVDVSFDEVQTIHKQFWELYSGVKRFEWKLKDEWRSNGGWIMNGIGRPLGIHADYTKDIVNRFSQSTGHDILVKYVHVLVPFLNYIEWYPIIMDFHDEVIIEVREEDAERAIDLFKQAEVELNRKLGGTIPLRINPIVCHSLADAKLE